ncbi:MAG: hypothetical protein WCJ30_23020, partial [Deltaproteobacteria bacterium]
LRALRARARPERVTVGQPSERRMGADALVQFATTIVNSGSEPIEIDRAQFQVDGDGTPLELVTAATRPGYYGSLADRCGVTGAWLGEHVQVLPGQTATGAVCFRRPAATATPLVRVTYGDAAAPAFSGHYLLASI